MSLWVRAPMGPWAHGLLGHGPMCPSAHETLVHEPMGLWATNKRVGRLATVSVADGIMPPLRSPQTA